MAVYVFARALDRFFRGSCRPSRLSLRRTVLDASHWDFWEIPTEPLGCYSSMTPRRFSPKPTLFAQFCTFWTIWHLNILQKAKKMSLPLMLFGGPPPTLQHNTKRPNSHQNLDHIHQCQSKIRNRVTMHPRLYQCVLKAARTSWGCSFQIWKIYCSIWTKSNEFAIEKFKQLRLGISFCGGKTVQDAFEKSASDHLPETKIGIQFDCECCWLLK